MTFQIHKNIISHEIFAPKNIVGRWSNIYLIIISEDSYEVNFRIVSIFKAQVKLRFTSAFNMLKFLSLSGFPNLDLNNPTNPLLKVYFFNSFTAVVDIVDIKEHRKLTPSASNNPVVLPLGKMMPYVDYFWKLIYM